MLDSKNLLETIKRAAIAAVESTKPVSVVFGQVLEAMPITIRVDQKLVLGALQLVVCESVGDLAVGDELILMRMQGGQKYIVMDRVKRYDTRKE